MEKTVSTMLEEFWTGILSQLAVYFAVFAGLLILYWIGMFYLNRGERGHTPARVYDVPLPDGSGADDPLAIPALNIPAAQRPPDQQFFRTVLDFARSKSEEGLALYPQERFALSEVEFVDRLLGPQGLSHFDSFEDHPPYKGWELRRAMEQINLPGFGELIERGVSIQLHRRQLVADMMATGMPRAQALAHPDLPRYAELQADIDAQGGHAALIRAADTYFEAHYPWSEG